MNEITIHPIGVVRSAVTDPSRDQYWGGVVSTIELDAGILGPDATVGLDQFSHIVVLFHLDRVPVEDIEFGTRHPRGNPDWPKIGILAQRAKRRPNRIGVSTCRLIGVSGLQLTVEALDAIDGTPVIDIKPYMAEFGPKGQVREPQWVKELMSTYFRLGDFSR